MSAQGKSEADRRFEVFRAICANDPSEHYAHALLRAIFDPLPPEPEPVPEPKSLGEVACEARWGDSVWPELDDETRARWERAAAAFIAEYERRNPRKVPMVQDVINELGRGLQDRSNVDQIARSIFPLFGCEP